MHLMLAWYEIINFFINEDAELGNKLTKILSLVFNLIFYNDNKNENSIKYFTIYKYYYIYLFNILFIF